MPGRDIIVVGASAGGVQALMELLRGLPADLPAAVFVVIHTSPASPGVLPQILQRAGSLTASYGADGAPFRHGHVYIAPPDHHLLIKNDILRVIRGPKENGFRPAVDPLFRTAARMCGPRTVGVVLSGGLDDGTEGLALIKAYGGIAVAQDPAEAPFPSMPQSAIAHVDVDHVLPVNQMPPLLDRLAREPLPEGALDMVPDDGEKPDVAETGDASLWNKDLPDPPSGLTCPECGGALWEMRSGKLLRYRCHVGHAYSAEGLVSEQSRTLEAALWSALRALEESAALRRRMAERARSGTMSMMAEQYQRQAEDAEARAALIRQTLMADDPARDAPAHPPQPKWDGRLYGSKGGKGGGKNGREKEKPGHAKAGGGKNGRGDSKARGTSARSTRKKKDGRRE